jgi:arginase
MTQYVCLGAPYYLGQPLENPSELQTIRNHTLFSELSAEWVDVEPDFTRFLNPVTAVHAAIANAISQYPDHTPLIFAPDCVSALGIMKGLERQSPDVVWLDAHGDFNTPQTTPSGFLGGMPLAALVGRGNEALMQGLQLVPISESRVTLSDARNLDPGESQLLQSSAVTHLNLISDLEKVNWSGKPVYLHLDTDVVDPTDMPTLHYPEPNGPSLEAVASVVKHIARSSRLVGAYISLWDGRLPGADKAREATFHLVRALVS